MFGKGTDIVAPDWHTEAGSNNALAPFMEALHSNASVRAAVARVGFHYPHRLADAATNLGPLYTNFPVPVWSSEESSTTDTPAGGACWARLLNQNYVIGNITATIMWNLVTSFYTSLPYYGASLMDASEPWSGHYEVKSPIWASAHHTQFAQPGWHYLARGSGVGVLVGGGTVVT
jgi:galactosylceramidase